MTAVEMEYEFKIVYESIASMNAPGYKSKEISVLLSQAQEEIAIEVAQKRMDSDDYARTVLEKLLTEYNTNNTVVITADTSLINDNSYNVTITPTTGYEFFHPFIEFAVTTSPSYQRVCKPIDYNSLYNNISNPYAKPYIDLYWRLFNNGKLLIITDGSTLTSIKGLYVKKPTPIITATITSGSIDGLTVVTNPVLNTIVHREIVNRAAMKAYAAVKDQAGYQLQNAEQQDN